MEGNNAESDPKYQKKPELILDEEKVVEFLGLTPEEKKKIEIAKESGLIKKENPLDKPIQDYLDVFLREMTNLARDEAETIGNKLKNEKRDNTKEQRKHFDTLLHRRLELEKYIQICREYAYFQHRTTCDKLDTVSGIKENNQVVQDSLAKLIPRETYWSEFVPFTDNEIQKNEKIVSEKGEDVAFREQNQIYDLRLAQGVFHELFPQNTTTT